MDPERWAQIERLYHLALEKEPGERDSFLARTCAGDASLRQEVESLLRVAPGADGYLKAAIAEAQNESTRPGSARSSTSSSDRGRKLGRYELQEQLGKGGMGVVYRAVDPAIGRSVAIKTILVSGGDGQQDSELRGRLLRESQASGQLSHPNIVAVYDVNEQDGVAYIVMEYVVGRTLDQAIRQDPSVRALPEALRILQDSAAALDYAHSRGIVHRDIKPANIMLHADGGVKIADFGIAKAAQFTPLTQSSVLLGSPHYMAPEQWRGDGVTGRTDQYALAVVAYGLVTGHRPFESDSTATLAAKVLYEEAPAATSLNPSLAPSVDTVFRRALSKTPSTRYETCGQFVSALAIALRSSPPVPTPSIPVIPSVTASQSSSPGRRMNWIAVAMISILLAVGALGVWLYQRNSVAQLEIAYWTSIKDSKTSAPFEEYLRRYPEGQFAGQARAQVDAFKIQPAANPPIATPSTSTTGMSSLPSAVPVHRTVNSPPPSAGTSSTPAPRPDPSASASDALQQAETKMKSGSYDEAASFFSRAIAAQPEYRPYFGRAEAYQHLNKIDQAIDDYTQAIHYNGSSAMAYHERAVCLARLNQDDRALPDYDRAIELSPAYALSWNGRGVIYLHRKDYPKAISDFTQAIRLNATFYQAYKNRAAARKAAGDIAGATADLNQANALKP